MAKERKLLEEKQRKDEELMDFTRQYNTLQEEA
jgi:hypothetical protein